MLFSSFRPQPSPLAISVARRRDAHGSTMSIANAENLVRIARDQISQRDINESLLKAVAELTREIKRLDDDVRRARREIQVGRRF